MSSLDTTPPPIEQVALFSTIKHLRNRMIKLQVEVDRQSEEVLNSIFVSSVDDVLRLRDTYNQAWFQKCLYSPTVKSNIAKRLLNAVNNYGFLIDTTIWTKLVGGSK